MPPPRATLLDPAVLSKLADFFLQRGGKHTGIFIVLAATAKLALGIIHGNADEIITGLFYEALAWAYLSLFFTTKRGNDMVATGLGEIKKESPNLKNASADPAINRVITKLELDVDPVGTATENIDPKVEG